MLWQLLGMLWSDQGLYPFILWRVWDEAGEPLKYCSTHQNPSWTLGFESTKSWEIEDYGHRLAIMEELLGWPCLKCYLSIERIKAFYVIHEDFPLLGS